MGMSRTRSVTTLNIPLLEEKFGKPFLASIIAHAVAFLILIYGGFILPSAVIQIGSGSGGGTGCVRVSRCLNHCFSLFTVGPIPSHQVSYALGHYP